MADDNLLLSGLDSSGVMQYREAIIKTQAALNEGRAVLFVRSGQLIEAQEFFKPIRKSALQRQLEIVFKGGNADESQLADAYSASATAYAGTNYRADQIASMPLTVTNPAGIKQEWNPAQHFISTAPIVLWHVEASLIIFGKSYLRKLYNEARYPTGLQWVHPSIISYDERLFGGRGGYIIRNPDDYGDQLELRQNEVICLDAFDPAGKGRSKSEYETALAAITTEQGASQFTAAFFINEARPDGILISKKRLDPQSEEYKQIKNEWKQFEGAGNAHKTFFATGEWEWIPVTPPLIDLALEGVNSQASLQISEVLRVNPALIGAAAVADQLSAQNTFRQIERNHIKAVTIPRLERLILPVLNEQWLWTDFSRPKYYTLAIDYAQIDLLSDVNTESSATALNLTLNGVGDYDEARHVMNLPPRETGAYFTRDPQKALDSFMNGLTYLDESRQFAGLAELLQGQGRIIRLPGGQIVPVSRLMEVANAQAEQLITQASAPTDNMLLPQFLSKLDNFIEIVRTQLISQQPTPIIIAQPPPVPATQPLLEGRMSPPARGVDKIEVALDLADNAFIRYAARTLSRSFARADVLSVAWIDPARWRLPLVSIRNINPTVAAALLREIELEETDKIDLTLDRVEAIDGVLCAVFETPPSLNKLQKSLGLMVKAAGVEGAILPAPALPLAYLSQAVEPNLLTLETAYPLSVGQVVLLVDNQVTHIWALRAASPAQLKELDNWHFRAKRHKPTADRPVTAFEPAVLADSRVANFISWGQALGANTEALFSRARALLKGEYRAALIEHDLSTPDEYETYWHRFDSLAQAVGQSWLEDYMSRAWDSVQTVLRSGDVPQEGDIGAALVAHHDDLIEQWIGTHDEPGALIKLVYAGMAAGNEAVLNNLPADYRAALRDIDIQIQWDLISESARDFVKGYSFDLIRNLDKTTQDRVRKALDNYLKAQQSLDELEEALGQTFTDPVRAKRIAETESIRAYNRGAELRWQQVGVTHARWMSVRDSKVCPICGRLQGVEAAFTDGAEHPGGQAVNEETNETVDAENYKGNRYNPPAHTGCRCFWKPQVPDRSTIDFSQFGGKPNPPNGGDRPLDPDNPAPSPAQEQRAKRQKMEVKRALDDAKQELAAIRSQVTARAATVEKMRGELRAVDEQITIARLKGDLKQEIEALYDKYFEVNEKRILERRANDKDTDLYKQLQKEQDELGALIEPLEAKLNKQIKVLEAKRDKTAKRIDKESAAVAESVKTPTPLNLETTQRGKFKNKERSAKLKEAQNWLKDFCNGDTYGYTRVWAYRVEDDMLGRSSADFSRSYQRKAGNRGEIFMSANANVRTYIHEMAHTIEQQNPDILRRCVEFREYRTQNERPRRLSEITGNPAYDSSEVAKPDNFYSPYVGKTYKNINGQDTATEVLSMGVELLYADPVAFQRDDPEYFDFIVAILRGLI